MQAVLASHRFNPGHLSHLLANARLLGEGGFAVLMRWHPRFSAMAEASSHATVTLAQVLALKEGDVYVLWFPSLGGLLDLLLLRLAGRRVHVVYVFHEPFTSYRSYRNGGFSRVKATKVYLIHLISAAIVRLSNTVILPSHNALAAFEHRYAARKASSIVLPLMFDDESTGNVPPRTDRRFVSYIGTIAEDHAFDRFVDFAQTALSQGRPDGLCFQIATRSLLDDDTRTRLAPFIASGRMKVQEGRPLTNDEINAAFCTSLVVWNAYKRSMQSGVLPKAYMFGTPVLVSEHNTSEFFEPGRHGMLVSGCCEPHELESAVAAIRQNFDRISAACREAFLTHFHYRASAPAFMAALHKQRPHP
jgi:glycosyltransferase involved in cell wall biosynthesis